ncbi:MAG TPA: SusD/RagB family nutrient-binding outer membrane lipoprotein [Chitinophagaceae bacterium]|nr:SusD/RagB family nutrient-binding outer membrane lipoprotein [Chitinophagaceae bacterium]
MKKKLFKPIYAAALFSVLLATSCTKDFEEINTDPNDAPFALPQQLLAPALVNSLTYTQLRNRNFNNELMQVTVDMSEAEGRVFRYDFYATWSDYLYNGLYTQLTNFKDIYKIAGDSIVNNTSYKAISLICQSWIYSILTDTYGDIPYYQSNLGKDSAIFEPRFDRQKDIYMGLFEKLEEANNLLTSSPAILASSDPVYAGNLSRWRKFGNSLYLRLLLRISGKAEVAQMCADKIKDIVETNASKYPIMVNQDESAILRWTGGGPYVSPFNSVREQDFRAPAIASFFIDNLVAWNDPRISIPLGTEGICRWGIAPASGNFIGVPSGYSPGSGAEKKAYFYSNTSKVSLQTEPMTGIMMTCAELKLILCEAAIKGWISGSPEAYYNDGALYSIKQWMPTWPTAPATIVTHLTAADMQWDDNLTIDQKMERIHLQKYYAMFLEDYQQWFEYRRTGHPVLPAGPGLSNNGVMPARMVYPVYVQSANPTNYQLAVAAQGPDQISTQVWWQKP